MRSTFSLPFSHISSCPCEPYPWRTGHSNANASSAHCTHDALSGFRITYGLWSMVYGPTWGPRASGSRCVVILLIDHGRRTPFNYSHAIPHEIWCRRSHTGCSVLIRHVFREEPIQHEYVVVSTSLLGVASYDPR